MSLNARDFIENLLKKNPNERMKSYKLLQHPFLAEESKKDERRRWREPEPQRMIFIMVAYRQLQNNFNINVSVNYL